MSSHARKFLGAGAWYVAKNKLLTIKESRPTKKKQQKQPNKSQTKLTQQRKPQTK